MNTKTPAALRWLLDVLLEVPGWPDAPWSQRVRRLIPIAIPLLLLLGLALWIQWVQKPARQLATREAHELLSVEQEIAELALQTSDAEFVRLRGEAEAAKARLVSSPQELDTLLGELSAAAQQVGWSARWVAGDVLGPKTPDADFRPQVVRAQLTHRPENTRPLATLVPLLEQFSKTSKRIDLIRLSIRADDQGWQSVELGLHAAVSPSYAKVAQ